MTIDQLRLVKNASPFRPFVIHIGDGREMLIHHQDFVAMSPSGLEIIAYQEDDSFEILDMRLITGLEVKKVKKNGKKPA